MTGRALVIHHLRPVPEDAATAVLIEAGYELDRRFPIEGDALSHPDEGHDIVLMHGSLADVTKSEAPGIAEEQRWIEAWWGTGRPFFGICHGLQLAAQLLGARVGSPEHGQAEFGYYPLISHAPDLVPDGLHVFQWHYYSADLPVGCKRLASSALYPNQAVRFGPARYGLQFHAELRLEDQQFLRTADSGWTARAGAQGTAEQEDLAAQHFEPMRAWLRGFVMAWLDEAQSLDRTTS
ncbi:MAG: hypothetical protein MI785_24680 [Kiloniellales bacterium]|nr:hypothetical protein [Kiloniellales bacterium]